MSDNQAISIVYWDKLAIWTLEIRGLRLSPLRSGGWLLDIEVL